MQESPRFSHGENVKSNRRQFPLWNYLRSLLFVQKKARKKQENRKEYNMTFEKEIQDMAHVKLSKEFFATINRQKQVLQNTICNIIDTALEDDKE